MHFVDVSLKLNLVDRNLKENQGEETDMSFNYNEETGVCLPVAARSLSFRFFLRRYGEKSRSYQSCCDIFSDIFIFLEES